MSVPVRTVKYLLLAEDMERAVGFWRDAFGAERTFGDEHWTETVVGGATIAFHGGHDGVDNPSGVGLVVDDIDAAVATVADHGGRVIDAPSRTAGEPVILATCADPEGNRFTLSQPDDTATDPVPREAAFDALVELEAPVGEWDETKDEILRGADR